MEAPATPARRAPSTTEIEVVLSDRIEDVDESLAVVHDGFVEAGYALPCPSGRRMHTSYLNPGTVFAVARVDGEPVGAAVLVVDGPFGLPSDRAFAEEVDALRDFDSRPLLECGSFVVAASWRRHTRRVFVRIMSALIRVAYEEFPGSGIVISVSPETVRFYSAIAGMVGIAGPRPLYGAPAILLRSPDAAHMVEHCRSGDSSGQRALARLIGEHPRSWLADVRSGRPLPDRWIRDLMAEDGGAERLAEQIRLLALRHPHALRAILGEAAGVLAA
jgi:hypothetical protein